MRISFVTIFILFLLLPTATALSPLSATSSQQQHHDGSAAPGAGSIPASIPKIDIASAPLALLPNQEVNVFGFYNKEPAPMGIADYGVGPNGPYSYSTNSSVGLASIVSLSADNGSGNHVLTLQLNDNLKFTVNGKPQVLWVQDVAAIDTSSGLIQFIDNIWNSSSPQGLMDCSAVSGSGTVAVSGKFTYYYDVASQSKSGNNIDLTYPVVVRLQLDSSVNQAGQPVVTFSYDDGVLACSNTIL